MTVSEYRGSLMKINPALASSGVDFSAVSFYYYSVMELFAGTGEYHGHHHHDEVSVRPGRRNG
jgi:hypothetical protein